jgi:hypothetical protein
MSSNRRILQTMLSPANNATRNNPHHNSSNAVRARLTKLIELRNAEQNETLPYSMTAASSDSSIYQFASDAGENLDILNSRGLLTKLGMQQVPAILCKELGAELYFNPECYPYFEYVTGSDNRDSKQHFATLLAMYACSPNATFISDAQRAAIDDYCEYNADSSVTFMVLTPILALGMLALLFLACNYRRDLLGVRVNSAAAASAPAVSHDPLTQRLLSEDQPSADARGDSHSREETPRRPIAMTLS